jgi:hypothetical protein
MKQTKGKLVNSLEKLTANILSELAETRTPHAGGLISEGVLEKSSQLG